MLPVAIYLSCLAITATGTCARSVKAFGVETRQEAYGGDDFRQVPECRSQCATVADWYDKCGGGANTLQCFPRGKCSDDFVAGLQSCAGCLNPLVAANATYDQAQLEKLNLGAFQDVCDALSGTTSQVGTIDEATDTSTAGSGAAGASGTSKATTTTGMATGKNTGAGTRMTVSSLVCVLGLMAVTLL